MLNNKGLSFIILLFVLSIPGKIYGVQIKWEPVYGAGGYIVEVVDSNDQFLIKKETRETSLDLGSLEIGIYKYRITTLNKLQQPGENTGWRTLAVKNEDAVEPFTIDFAIGIGWEYNIVRPRWSDSLNNSYKGLNLYISFPFSQIDLIKDVPFISSCGFEIFATFSQYSFTSQSYRSDLKDRYYSITGIHAGFNYTMGLDQIDTNLKLVFNIDSGLSYSKYTSVFEKFGESDIKYSESTLDVSVMAGTSVRYFWTDSFFTDFSMQYYKIFYITYDFNDIKLILRAGMFF